ncbi:hypothetical protein E2986_10960 [Frieseomelitta varia]|uniref:ARID domain-containing protein n=1 Tax=Frieseomelitta varia TaxID=561572 RepID=A0A833VR04_9HYME|nr:hypothetical protein E2986_10960 [Frieseomelitta varia]
MRIRTEVIMCDSFQILNKDPVTYERERENFLKDLRHFHETRGTPFKKNPKINGKDIDLYLLYVVVTAHGGWIKSSFSISFSNTTYIVILRPYNE